MTPTDGLPTPRRYYAMVVVVLGITMSVLDGTIVNLALPTITRDLQSSAAHSIWIINAYQICTLAFLLPCANLGDRIGYRRVYLGGLILFTLASLGCAVAGSLPVLAATRAIQGLGAAGIMSVNLALVRLIYPKHLLGRGLAINSMAVATASVAGPSMAAAILATLSWPWLFAVNLPIGIAVLWLGSRALPQNAQAPVAATTLSWMDVLLNALMFSLIFIGARVGGTHENNGSMAFSIDTASILMLLSGVVLGVIYFRRQSRLAAPVFPVDLLRIPAFALSTCTSVATFTAQAMAYIALPFLLLDAYGHSPAQAGLLITAWPLTVVVTAPLAGYLIDRYPDGLLAGIGLVCFSAGLALLAGMPATPANFDIAWRLAICGFGFGMFQSPNNHAIITTAPLNRSGGASGMLGTARLTGQTLGAVLAAVAFTLTNAHNGHGPSQLLTIAAGFSAVAGVFSLLRLRLAPAEDLARKPTDRK